MILHRFIGMRNGNIRQIRISAILCRPKQHFQIYHIIHDCVVSAKQLYIAGHDSIVPTCGLNSVANVSAVSKITCL